MEKAPQAILDGVEERLLRWMLVFAALCTAVFLWVREPLMAAGFLAGAAISVLAFRWLERGMAAALDASRTRVPKSIGIKLMLRFPILIAVLFVFYGTHWLPIDGVVLGFFVPIAGAMTESLVIIGRLLLNRHAVLWHEGDAGTSI